MSARDDLLERQPDEGFTAARWAAVVDVVLAKHAHELAEEIRQGGVRYDLREFNAARAAGPGRTLEFVQSAVADFIDPEVSDG